MGIKEEIAKAGGGPRVARLSEVGSVVRGKIISADVTQALDDDLKLAFWDDGGKKEVCIVTFQTDLDEGPNDDGEPDDGKRRFYVKWWSDQKKALIAAVKHPDNDWEAAGLDPDLHPGADFAVKFVSESPPAKKQWSPSKNLKFKVGLPPKKSVVADDFDDDDEPVAEARNPAPKRQAAPAKSAAKALAEAGLDDADDF